jgi:hypothetical protein
MEESKKKELLEEYEKLKKFMHDSALQSQKEAEEKKKKDDE